MADIVHGIILRQTKTAGGRRMLEIFTKEFGKISASTFGDRKGKNKSNLATRPFTLGEYSLTHTRGMYSVSSAEVERSFYGIGEDPDRFQAAAFVLELTDKAFQENVPSEEAFFLLRDFLTLMENRKKGFQTPVLAYELHLLEILGVFPVLDYCAVCGAKREACGALYFGVQEGGILCEHCAKNIMERTGGRLIYEADFGMITSMEYFVNHTMEAFSRLALEPAQASRMQRIVREYMAYYLEIGRLRSEAMLDFTEGV